MKRLTVYIPPAFVAVSALLFVLSCLRGTPTASAAAPAAHPAQMSSAHYALDWSAAGEISGGDSASANYKLTGTTGQMGAGSLSASANAQACTGFECVLNNLGVYLPFIKK